MRVLRNNPHANRFTVVESPMTLHAQLLLLCARIGYSPHPDF
jgi:hypothetical protein